MANATTLNIGQVNGAGQTDALFLKVFSGEVLTAFETASVTRERHFVRTISSGKSASFPATWKVTGGYHTPGNEIVGQTSNVNERVITIDDLLVSSVFIPNIDEAKNHCNSPLKAVVDGWAFYGVMSPTCWSRPKPTRQARPSQ